METTANFNTTLKPDFNTTLDSSVTVLPYARMFYLAANVIVPAGLVILLFGMITNITNIVVFLKAGVKDNVSTLLLSLSISDLTFIILTMPTALGLAVSHFFIKSHLWPFDFRFVHFLFYWPAYTVYDISAFISVSLGVMRCACVAMPLKFKLVFTKRRTVIIVLALLVLAVSLRAPVLTIFRVAWRTDSATNVSSAYLTAVNRESMTRINDVMNRGLVVWVNYTIMVSCVGLLSFKLAQASRIRRSYTSSGDQTKDKTSANNRLTPKDLQAVKSVVLICLIFILSQLPFMLYSTARLINPEFTSTSRMQNLFGFFSQCGSTCSYLNASLNIFVYYNYNTKYRTVFLSLLPFKKKK
ncbi:chemosensory receptor A [Elysia marginata]|uniref:Chemosensory receptor A n=1 Tax=Elysia marginata TaxID=1093978 RepID=A0AAV4GJE2_9GAST|nr:chemosensory receptor A [Elysia marginata]